MNEWRETGSGFELELTVDVGEREPVVGLLLQVFTNDRVIYIVVGNWPSRVARVQTYDAAKREVVAWALDIHVSIIRALTDFKAGRGRA